MQTKHMIGAGGILGAAVLAVTGISAAAAISSNVYIQKDEAFLLGGTQKSNFTVKGTNTGPVAVKVLARSYGSDNDIATVQPGAKFKQVFVKGEIAVLQNTSSAQTASVKVRVTGYTKGLGMRYEGG
ncbi:hypothetical protein [Altererythrobacter sp. ZODW24]|uniref:hypothetical protein n=1 Tax=Altererythrobacter sp. ZODW24 TaxID=2185142 RepID=UPI0013B4707A|nr:hypothetical protein [Altererythrobacter sp. ZODW24]